MAMVHTRVAVEFEWDLAQGAPAVLLGHAPVEFRLSNPVPAIPGYPRFIRSTGQTRFLSRRCWRIIRFTRNTFPNRGYILPRNSTSIAITLIKISCREWIITIFTRSFILPHGKSISYFCLCSRAPVTAVPSRSGSPFRHDDAERA